MKKIISLCLVLVAALSLMSCADDDTPQLNLDRTELPTLNSLGQDVMYVYNNQNTKYTFTWSQARFFLDGSNASTSIGFYEQGGIHYELQCDSVGSDFSQPISAGSVTSLTNITIDAATLANAVEAVYPQPDSIIDLEFRLKVQWGSADTMVVYSSNVLPVTLDYSGMTAGSVTPHDPYKIYVDDRTGWSDISLYVWNDNGDVADGWPGVAPTSTAVIGGVEYKVWELSDAYQQASGMHFIFNSSAAGVQIDDVLSGVSLTSDVYLRLNADNSFEILPDPYAKTVRVYVQNNSGWSDLYLYMWGGNGDLVDGWPGVRLDGGYTVTLNGVTYQEYYLPAAYVGQADAHLIFHNNNGTQFDAQQGVTLDHDLGVKLQSDGCSEAALPARIFVEDNSGWDGLALYAWTETGNMLPWPGVTTSYTENINGINWKVFVMPSDYALNEVNYIFNNNNNGSQFDAMGGYKIGGETFVTITNSSYILH